MFYIIAIMKLVTRPKIDDNAIGWDGLYQSFLKLDVCFSYCFFLVRTSKDGVVSMPTTWPESPTSSAAKIVQLPVPHPISKTRSPSEMLTKSIISSLNVASRPNVQTPTSPSRNIMEASIPL